MKRVFLCCLLFVCMSFNNVLFAQEIVKGDALFEKISMETMYPYFDALQNGDVDSIKKYIAGDKYEEERELLEENTEYPDFLRNSYMDVDFWVEKAELFDSAIMVFAIIESPEYGRVSVKYLLQNEMAELHSDVTDEVWKIVKQFDEE